MRILMIHTAMEHGGTESLLAHLIDALRERGHEVTLAAAPGPRAPSADADFIPLSRMRHAGFFTGLRRYWGNCRALLRVARAHRYHIVNVHARFMYPLAWYVTRRTRTPLVFTMHNVFDTLAWLSYRADRFIAVSGPVARMMMTRFRIDPSLIRVVHNGIPDRGTPPLDAPPTANVVLAVCRLERDKGVDVLLRAVASLRDTVPGLALRVAGEGSERDALVALARTLGVADIVRFDGWVDDAAPLYDDARVFALASRAYEGLPMAILEAMRAALPVVATRVGGVEDAVTDGETGLLVPPDSADELARALARLLKDPQSARRMGARGRERWRAEFSRDRMADETVRVYRELTGG